jgi:hypothetical protein
VKNVSTTRRRSLPVLVAGLAFLAFGCTTGGGGATTTTTTTTTTTSTTSTTINPACATYVPTGVVVSDPSAAAGDTITVSGNGVNGTIEVSLAPVGPGTATGVLATTTVSAGTWSTAVTIPNTVTAGSWNVVARAQGCSGEGTAAITIV